MIIAAIVLRSLPFVGSTVTVLLARWLVGVLLCYATADTLVGVIRVVYRLFGLVPPPIHRHPILSKSVGEFWSRRWNLPVHEWLWRHCFKPVARRSSVTAGVAIVFAVSMLMHAWTIVFGAGLSMALLVAAFFLIQGVLVVVERSLRVAYWPNIAARAWAASCVIGTLPLFIEPILRIAGL